MAFRCARCKRKSDDPDYRVRADGVKAIRHVCEKCVRAIRTDINGGPDKGVGELYRKKERP